MAGPREAGTPEAGAAREAIRQELEQLGWSVTSERFEFSPQALEGFPLFGAGLGAVALMQFPLLVLPGLASYAALLVLVLSLGGVSLLAWLIGRGAYLPGAERREDANLIALRGTPAQVRRWIVAHFDTKAQGQSMAGRLVAIWCVLAVLLGLTGQAIARLAGSGPLRPATVAPVLGLAVVAGALAGRARLKGGSPGARDNGTGILALLEIAGRVTNPQTGLLVTGAEEFGMVGARIFAARRGDLSGVEVINLDTLADRGQLYLIHHDRAGAGLAVRLAQAGGLPGGAVIRRLPIGILVDSLPLARRGASAVTLSRLDWQVLRLMHTPRDRPGGLELATALETGRVVAALPLAD